MLKKTEHHSNVFENYGGGATTDRTKLPNYRITSLSPLRFANEDLPVDFQVKMDERNRQMARKFQQSLREAFKENGNLAKIKILEDRARHLETLLTEQEALHHVNQYVKIVKDAEVAERREKRATFHNGIVKQMDFNTQNSIMKNLALTPGEYAMNKDKIMGLPITTKEFVIDKAAGVKIN